jgi:uncharacterized repeat protein (TIGR01451 family)
MQSTSRRPHHHDHSTGTPPPRGRRILITALLTTLGAGGLLGAGSPFGPFGPSSAGAAELALPFHTAFDTADGGTLSGDATIDDGWLRLTSATEQQAGSWLTDDVFPSDRGLDIEFHYAMHGGTGADGLLLSLSDGAVAPGVGRPGGALGYSCYDTSGLFGACDVPGMPGAYVGLGFDRYGFFSITDPADGPQYSSPDHVVLRGSGNGTDGYRLLGSVPAPGAHLETGSRADERTVRVTVEPDGNGVLALTARMDTGPGTALRTVLDHVLLDGPGQAPLPPTLRLGFTGSTGAFTNVHEIDDLVVSVPTDLAVTQDLAERVVAGSHVQYTATVRNKGTNDAPGSAVSVTVPAGLDDVRWSCAAGPDAACGDAEGTGNALTTTADLGVGSSVVYTIEGDLRASATGDIESIATVTPPASRVDTDESDNRSAVSGAIDVVAGLRTEKSVTYPDGADSVVAGGVVEYTVTAVGVGPAAARGVGVVDDLPAAVRFVDSSDGCSAEAQRVTCESDAVVEPGGRSEFRFRARLDADYRGDGSNVVNIAVASSPDDPDGGDPSEPVRLVVDPTDGGADGGVEPTPTSSPTGPAGPSGQGDGGTGGSTNGSASGRGPGALAFTGSVGTSVLVATGVLVLVAGLVLVVARRQRRRHEQEVDGARVEAVGPGAGIAAGVGD